MVAVNRGRSIRSTLGSIAPEVVANLTLSVSSNQFLAQDGCLGWGVDSEPHVVAVELHDGDSNTPPDSDLLRFLAGQYQHSSLLAVRLA
jgi:hypothetical protein